MKSRCELNGCEFFCEDTIQPTTVMIESLGRQVHSQTWAHSNSQRLDILIFKRDIVHTYLPLWVVMKNWMKYLWTTLVHYKGLYIYVKCFYYKENILRYILLEYIITCRNTKWMLLHVKFWMQLIIFSCIFNCTSLVPQTVKRLSTMQETWVRSLGREDPLEKEMATHSSTLAWKIPWMEEPGREF